jgi:hypothetical protein
MPLAANRRLSPQTSPRLPAVPALALTALLAVSGCSRPTSDATVAPAAAAGSQASANMGDREVWEINEIAGKRVGYAKTTIHPETVNGRSGVRIEGLSQMKFQRAGQGVEMEVQFDSTETADGHLVDFNCKIAQGAMLIQQTSGRVEGDQLQLNLTTMGKTLKSSIPWSTSYGGLIAGEQSLWRSPMKPGETRKFQALMPGFNLVATTTLAAQQYEPVEILGKSQELLRIDMTTTFGDGQSQRGTLWTDRQGEILRKREEAMDMMTIRVPKAVALAEPGGNTPYDLMLGMSVNLDRPLNSAHASRRIRYVLQLDGANPADVFPSGCSQAIKSLGTNEAEVTVYAVRPDQPGNASAPADPPSDEDRQANNMIQSDNPAVVALAQKVAPEEKDPWKVAVALEKYVRGYIVAADYSQAFATAAQVAESRRGDCTEHAVLLAALARARGIPARVAVGLVYTEQTGQPSFGFHMWDEVYVADRWIPLDATLARGGIGAAHLKLAHTSLASASAFTSFLPVAQVAGKLRIKVAEVE